MFVTIIRIADFFSFLSTAFTYCSITVINVKKYATIFYSTSFYLWYNLDQFLQMQKHISF